MTKIFLGLGSNVGDRKQTLELALERLQKVLPQSKLRVSPLYETPALLPKDAPSEWNQPFFNLALEAHSSLDAEALLQAIKKIEFEFGLRKAERWSPRMIDIDLLLYGSEIIDRDTLKVPHLGILDRAFVLDPLKDLDPLLQIPQQEKNSVLKLARRLPQHSPIWMGIFNLTPDSFSDGGSWQNRAALFDEIESCEQAGVGILDFGGESTRPGAAAVSWTEEWERLQPVLSEMNIRYSKKFARSRISVDTRHFEVLEKALELGADIINDVSGLSDLRMLDLVKSYSCEYVLMHSLSIPADPKNVISKSIDPIVELKSWFSQKLEVITSAGVDIRRVILDPGIGFGKSGLHSLEILNRIEELQDLPCRLLVGHSRKSFMKIFSALESADRDVESMGMSLALAKKGVDILRVHNPIAHKRAHLAFNHISSK